MHAGRFSPTVRVILLHTVSAQLTCGQVPLAILEGIFFSDQLQSI